ncbi:PLP-dependent aminotransferase family protein [Budviciaceae bacterium CWB-B4]|uniref:PLP-dependent aminotransferase family protein n=1 Tax=Limnobaculum xujianqingii TaxID=2738837 RepID=A0A9D7FSJ9_9GAMM|nr:PLP-dependent aminotransferase family protein [Limnobaculum xujianqingii]MBK5072675.1 PLP-dependent aminotransferase family protein [Limnobaculum xujianqingii]MBK5175984.1 PLP-dependent aminotransferase family protein [Limnobaculum xujianqingii]
MLTPIDQKAGTPLYFQVASSIKKYLENYPAGHKLPSQRAIALKLNVSKTTVVEAFNLLQDEEVISIREKSRAISTLRAQGIDWQLLIQKACHSRIQDDVQYSSARSYSKSMLLWPGMDFSPQMPLMAVSDAVSRRIASKDLMNYDDIGFHQLRELLASHLKTTLAIDCSPEEIVITSGISNALYIISSTFFSRLSPVVYESPGYYEPILTSLGASAIPLPMCAGGISTDSLQKVLMKNRYAFYLTTPLCHWPTCHMTDEPNKRAQYEICRTNDNPIIEVDAMRGLFDAPLPMRSYPGSASNVIYVGTFTNTIGHSMRLAWIVAPRNTVKRLLEVKSQVEPRVSTLIQIYAEEMLRSGAYEQFLSELKAKVRQQNDGVENILSTHLAGKASWHGMPSISRLITFPTPLNERSIIKMQGQQISLLPLQTLDKNFANSLYMYCAADSLSSIETLISKLSSLAN